MDWDYTDTVELTEETTKEKLKMPPMFKVILHNDDYTTMEFVVYIIENVFHKSLEEAVNLMLKVHNEGLGVCGIYSAEIAETKVATVTHLAREQDFPLKCTMEEE